MRRAAFSKRSIRPSKQGKTRFVGFTGHKDPLIHLRMIQLGYPFDTVQMPLNPFDATYRSFEQIVLPEANKRGIGVLGMKSFGGTADSIKARRRHSPGVASLRDEPSRRRNDQRHGFEKTLRQNVAVAQNFKPYSPDEMNALRDALCPVRRRWSVRTL